MTQQLGNLISPHTAIYKQVISYYQFCEQVRCMSRATMTSKVYAINNFVHVTKLSDLRRINNQHIYDWIRSQQLRGNSGRSINDRLVHLLAMIRWQREMNLRMPKLKLALITKVAESPPRKVCFSRAEITQVLSESTDQEWLMVSLAFDCGLRISELQQLKLSDLSHARLTIIGKGNKRRYAYVSPEVHRRLRLWIDRNHITGYFWPSPIRNGYPLAICTIRDIMQTAFRRAGYYDFCPHDLRHSYATDLKLLGVSTRQIQAGLGHATELTTEHYLSDIDSSDLRTIYNIKYAQSSNSCGKPQKSQKLPKKVH